MPLRQDERLVADGLYLTEDVAGQDDRVDAAQLPDEAAQLDDLRRVEAHGGFVQNDELRTAQQRLRHAHPLAVALREAADEPGQDIFQTGTVGGRLHLCRAVGFLDAFQFGGKVEVLGHRHLRVKGRLFRQITHAGLGGVGFLGQRMARHRHLPLRGGEITGEDVHDGGLTGTVRPQQAVDDAVLHRERDVVHCKAAAVFPGEVGYFYHKKRSFSAGVPGNICIILARKCVRNKINLCAFPNIVSFALMRQFSRPDAKRAPLPAKGTTLLEAL